MKKLFLTFFITMLITAATAFGETLTLTTYYPAPFGAYDQLRLVPRAALSGSCQIGTFYVQTPDLIQYCRDNGAGSGVWGTLPGVWTENGNNIYPTNTASNPNLMVGIGTSAPSSEFDVRGTITSNVTAKSGNPLGLRIMDTSTLWYLAPARCNGCYAPGATAGDLVLRSANNKSFLITTANGASTALAVKSDGKVGIETTNPSAQMEVAGTGEIWLSESSPQIKFNDTDAGAWRYWIHNNGNRLYFLTDEGGGSGWTASRPLTIYQTNVGIGTATPSRLLHVEGQGQINTLFLKADGTNVGELKASYSGGAYYATYAP